MQKHPNTTNKLSQKLGEMGLETIKLLEAPHGILASSRNEIYGCLFGRDSLITSLLLLQSFEKTQDVYFLYLTKKILVNLAKLQGTEINIESGEEPGKILHEYRTDNHDHLTQALEKPWFVYPDNTMRNYDSLDSTPLFLIATYRYFEATQDEGFIEEMKPHIYAALDWLVIHGDKNHDKFLDYQLHPDRKHGGLDTQSWMDSSESVFHEDLSEVAYPIAPVEVQAYAYTALKSWSAYFENSYEARADQYNTRAKQLKEKFNKKFVYKDTAGNIQIAAGIDGNGKRLESLRSSIGHCLWTTWNQDGADGSVLDSKYIPLVVERLMSPEIFEPKAGIRTLSKNSSNFDAASYHNGSIWPHDNEIIAKGFLNFGFDKEAKKIRAALIKSISHFNTPIELFVFDNGKHSEYMSPTGNGACKEQAWSAAAIVSAS